MIGDLAHICNRGVEKRKIFIDESDYLRFVQNLLFLNNQDGKIRIRRKDPLYDIKEILFGRKKLVEILKWSLLPNHYHLLLYEVSEGGILEFTKRLGNAYTKYFNTKNKGRRGYLFQNSAKIIPILKNNHFLYMPIYIDLNCSDLICPNWKNTPKNDSKKILNFLKSYRWSSFRDCFTKSEFENVSNVDLFYDLFDTNAREYMKELEDFLENPLADVAGWSI
ncbi:MAG: hypothetical protein PHT16_00280 [Candidatus Pacebacteria bacterium]|nr:hypothetical protein [Candidatus Paceibacterota bacterium]